MSLAHAPSQPETIVLDDRDMADLAQELTVSARAALAPSAYLKLCWSVEAGLKRRIGAAITDARRFADEAVELRCLQRELTRHQTGECASCCAPGLLCTVAAEMERRENDLLGRLAEGFR